MVNNVSISKEKIITYIKSNKKILSKYILPILVLVALLLIWAFGNNSSENIAIAETKESYNDEVETLETFIYVDIDGEINNPGVYKVLEGSRVFQIIEMAGGFTDKATTVDINQAEIVYDGEKIIVSSLDQSNSIGNISSNGKININRADLSTLTTLPGIGESKGQRIIDYRTSNGRFKTIEDIMNVSGIGEATFNSLKDLITV